MKRLPIANNLADRMEEILQTLEGFIERARQTGADWVAGEPREYLSSLVHQLRTQQIELEMQNEELRKSERELIKSRTRYADLFEFAPVGYLTLNAKGVILEANLTLAAMLGVDRGCLIQTAFSSFVCPDDQDTYYHHLRHLKDSAERQKAEVRLQRKDRDIFWAGLDSVRINPPEASARIHFRIAISDIGPRKQALEALRTSEQTFRSIYDAANDAIFIHNMHSGCIVDVNQTMCEMYGYAREEARRVDVGMLSAGDAPYDQEHAMQWVSRAVAGKPQVFEWHARHKDGHTFWVEVNLTRARIGSEDRILAVVRDIEDRKKSEQERTALEKKIHETQKLESLGILAGGIAHDFNNLLIGVMGNADLAIMDSPPGSPALPYIEDIKTTSVRLSELTNQMLAYSGKGKFLVEEVCLSKVIEEMAHLLARTVTKKAFIRFGLDHGLPLIRADVSQVRQVAMNLMINAAEAIGENSGTITLGTGLFTVDSRFVSDALGDPALPLGDYICLEVTDTGCGMTKETIEKIFDPFFTTKFTGRGLGLAAVLGIMKGHGGGIKVHSKPGEGTTFRLLFPCTEHVATELTEEDPEPALQLAEHVRGAILLVDDEETVLSVAGRMLEREGLSVVTAANGREALDVLHAAGEGEIAVVLLDLTMPHMDGVETFREIHRLWPDLPVVLSSGYSEQEARSHFAGEGLVGFIHKPYEARQLAGALSKVLAERAP